MRRAAVIGLGAAGGFVLDAFAANPGIVDGSRVDGVDPAGDSALAAARVPGRVLTSIAALDAVDLAVVTAPTALHTPLIEELAAAGVGEIWCDKPLAVDRSELARCRSAGADVRALLHTAFAPEVLWGVERARSLGPVVHAEGVFADPFLGELDRYRSVKSGSWLDSGINGLSVLARFVAGLAVTSASGDGVLSARCDVRFDGGGSGSITTRWTEADRDKHTTLRFASGETLRMWHSITGAQVSRAELSTGERAEFVKESLAARYVAMFASYAANDALAFSSAAALELHALLFDAADARRRLTS